MIDRMIGQQWLRRIILFCSVAIVESLQWVIALAIIFSFSPIEFSEYAKTFFPFCFNGFTPEREMIFYRFFIAGAILIQVVLLFFYKNLRDDSGELAPIRAWLKMAACFVFLQLFFSYHALLSPKASWPKPSLYVICVLAFLVRLFWAELYQFWAFGEKGFRKTQFPIEFLKKYKNQGAVFLLILAWLWQTCLYVFALKGTLSRSLLWPPGQLALFLMLGAGFLIAAFFFSRFLDKRKSLGEFVRQWAWCIALEVLLTFFMLSALFKLHIFYYEPLLAQRVYCILLVVGVLSKMAWPWLERFLRVTYSLLMDNNNAAILKMLAQAACIVFIFFFIYVPDPQAALARVFMGEQFHHTDATLMNTSWAYYSGCKLNVDVNNRYGLGMAVIVSSLMHLFGEFNYVNVLLVVMFGCIIYFIAAYFFLRYWLNSIPLAIAGILLALKMIPFHDETSSYFLSNATTTPCRYFFDIFFLFALLLFLQTAKRYYLFIASLIAGIALFYAMDTGAYLTLAYYVLLFVMLSQQEPRSHIYKGIKDARFLVTLFINPLLVAFILLFLSQGSAVFMGMFWSNMTEYYRMMVWATPLPYWEPLKAHEWWSFGIGQWIPLAYIFTLLFVGSLYYLRKVGKEHLMVIFLCVYGLILYHYYVNRTTITSCYSSGIMPYICIIFFWIQILIRRFWASWSKQIYLVLILVCFYALMTTHLHMALPAWAIRGQNNLFNNNKIITTLKACPANCPR